MKAKKEKIVVLGAGLQGSIAVLDLCDREISPGDRDVVVCDYIFEKAEAAAQAYGAQAMQCDVTDHEALIRAIRDADVVINCVQYDWNIEIMQACLEVGAHYMDLGGLFHITQKQFELDKAFRDAGLLAVLGMGSSPGIMNVMAGYAAERLDTVREANVICGCADYTPTEAAIGIPYSLTTIMEEHTMEPWILTNGELKPVPPGSGKEIIAFSEPIGNAEACYCLHSEPAQFYRSFKEKGIREASFKLALPAEFEEKIKFLADVGFGSTEPIGTDGCEVTPLKVMIRVIDRYLAGYDSSKDGELNDCDVLRVVVKGGKNGIEKEYVMESVVRTSKRWGISAGALDTGVPPSIIAQMICRGLITKRGALSPEECVPPVPFFREMAKREMPVTVIEKTPLSADDFAMMDSMMKRAK